MAAVLEGLLKREILEWLFRGAAAPSVTGPFVVSLHTADPGTTRANEVSTGVWTNYARQNLARTSGGFAAAANTGGNNERIGTAGAAPDFGTATIVGTAPVVTHVEVWDSAGSPRRVGGMALTTPQTINNGNPVKFNAAGDLNFNLNG